MKRIKNEEDAKRRKAAKTRFRNLIRSVMFNRAWLQDADEQKLSLNVKKNIALLVRTQRKVGMLTVAEKSLILSNHYMRTIEERRQLVVLLLNLNCFSKYPPKVRARLAPVIKFMVLGPGRVLIKEGQEPKTVYFLLSGEVEMTRRVYDHLKGAYVDRLDSISGPGDCVGDIEMIEKCRRRTTCTTTNECEVLLVNEEDFDQILLPVLGQQWEEKKKALEVLGYFKDLSKDQLITACKLGYIKQYDSLETIYYEDQGPFSPTHFIISGECLILQCLKISVTMKNDKKQLQLCDFDPEDNLFHLDEEALKKVSEKLDRKRGKFTFDVDAEIESDEDEKTFNTKRIAMKKMDIKGIEIACGLRKPSNEDIEPTSALSVNIKSEMTQEDDDGKDDDETVERIETLGLELHTERKSLKSTMDAGNIIEIEPENTVTAQKSKTLMSRQQSTAKIDRKSLIKFSIDEEGHKEQVDEKKTTEGRISDAMDDAEESIVAQDDLQVSEKKKSITALDTKEHHHRKSARKSKRESSKQLLITDIEPLVINEPIEPEIDPTIPKVEIIREYDMKKSESVEILVAHEEAAADADDPQKILEEIEAAKIENQLKAEERKSKLSVIVQENVASRLAESVEDGEEEEEEEGEEEEEVDFYDDDIEEKSEIESGAKRIISDKRQTVDALLDSADDIDTRESMQLIYNRRASQLSVGSEGSQASFQRDSSFRKSKADIETHFIDVGSLTFGGIFGLGEVFEDRVIMARTTVQCFLLPRYWLFEKEQNPGNIWQRRRTYIEQTIPSRKKLFKDLITTHSWQKFKKNLLHEQLKVDMKSNPTKVQDVPVMLRIVEATEEDSDFETKF